MAGGVACRRCGSRSSGWFGRCPRCGSRSARGRAPAWAGLAVVSAIAAVSVSGLVVVALDLPSRIEPSPEELVEASTGGGRLTSDGRATEVTGVVHNKGRVAVDVTVRFRAFDAGGGLISEVESGPHRNILKGQSKTIGVTIPAIAIERLEVEVLKRTRSAR